jgi:hypothetical protein
MSRNVLSFDWDWVTGSAAVGCNSKLCGHECKYPFKDPCRSISRKLGDGHRTWVEIIPRLHRIMQLTIKPDAKMFMAENHVDILQVLKRGDQVIDFDHHFDGSLEVEHGPTCGNWRVFAADKYGAKLPNAHQYKGPALKYDVVFVCKSSPWTPKKLDGVLWGLVDHLRYRGTKNQIPIKFLGLKAVQLAAEYEAAFP